MQLSQLWRHPVKSLQGQSLDEAAIDTAGLAGDRLWGVRDTTTGRVLTGRREARLLLASAVLGEDDGPHITLPDGTTLDWMGPATDAALSAWLGKPVALIAAKDAEVGEFYEDPIDETSPVIEWTMPAGRFVDLLPLLVITTATLRAGAAAYPDGVWDVRRFRPNLVVDVEGDDWAEDAWCGKVLRVGAVELDVRVPCPRCTMVTRPQPGLERDLDIFRTLNRVHGATLGVWAHVRAPGTVGVGDSVEVL